jgi:hypothetical protein
MWINRSKPKQGPWPKQPRRAVLAATASCTSFLVSGTFALLLLAQNRWFGAGDLRAFVVYSAGLALLLGVVAAGVTPMFWKWSPWSGYVGGALLGLGAGYVFALGNLLLLGPWFGAWSFPVLECWLAGGLAGGVAAALSLERTRPGRALAAGASLLALLVTIWLGYSPLMLALSGDQRLTVVLVKWIPSDQPLTIKEQRGLDTDSIVSLGEDALSLIRSAGVRGHIEVWGRSIHGRGPNATAVVLLQSPIPDHRTVRQPDRTTALYVQGPGGFQMFPASAKTLDREIALFGGPRLWYSVRLANDGVQSGSAFEW